MATTQQLWGGQLKAATKLASWAHGFVLVYAQLRADCEARGHALAQRAHTADRWIAATAIRLGVPLVSNDKIFREVPNLALESLAN